MQEDFNPYLQWLGRADGQPPANYYELLGIRCYEGDPATISQAADAWIARLRAIHPGPHAAVWQQIVDQLNWAKVCLLDPRAKAGYDSALRGQQMAAPAAPSAPPPQTTAAAAAEAPLDSAILTGVSYQHTRRAHTKSRKPQLVGWFLTLLVLVSIAAFTALLLKERQRAEDEANATAQAGVEAGQRTPEAPLHGKPAEPKSPVASEGQPSPEKKPEATPDAMPAKDDALKGLPDLSTALAPADPASKKSDAKDDSAAEKAKSDKSASPGKSPDKSGDKSAAKVEAKPAGPIDPAKQEAMEQELSKARDAMAERKFPAARQHVKAALANAQTDADRGRCQRAGTLLGYLEEFWKRMREILASLQPGDEVASEDAPMVVVSADAKEVTFRSEARNQTYSLDRLPNPIVMALVRERFAKKTSANVLLGAYLSVDAEGDPGMACRLWQEATKDGVDMTDMLTDLTAATSLMADGSKPEAPSDEAKLKKAEEAMKAKFQAEFAEATTPAKKAELATTLLERSRAVKGDQELRFVMLREAKEQATGALKASLACTAVERLARYFAVDEVAMKVAAMEEVAKKVRGSQAYKETTEQVLKVIEQALAKTRIPEAKQLVPVAAALAKKSSNKLLMNRVKTVSEQVSTARPPARKTEE